MISSVPSFVFRPFRDLAGPVLSPAVRRPRSSWNGAALGPLLAAVVSAALLVGCSSGDDGDTGGALVGSVVTDGSGDSGGTGGDSGGAGDAGGDDGTGDGTSSSTSTSSTSSTGPSDGDGEDDGQDDGEGDGDEPLPGQPWDGFASEGDVLAVLGVEADDVLNIRSVPGLDGEIVATAAPQADLVATGRARALPSSFWYEVDADGTVGWAAVGFLAFEAATDDATAEYLAERDRATADSMEELGRVVARYFASEDPPSEVVVVAEATVGDLGEIVVDVVGIGDDSGAGYRLGIFAETDGEVFTLRTIERTTFCTRGVSGELCL